MRKTYISALFLFFFFQFSLWALTYPASIMLYNDSPAILTASVYSHGGQFLGQLTLQPGQQQKFVSTISSTKLTQPSNNPTSLSPFRVVWQCAGGDPYSMCIDASTGAFVRASSCPGALFCIAKQDKKQPTGPMQPPSQGKE